MHKKSNLDELFRIILYRLKEFYKFLDNKFLQKSDLKYKSLMEAKKPKNRKDHKLIFCFNPGRSGTRWLSNIFDSHENWIGTCERLGQYESFTRYCTWHNLNVDLEGVFKLLEQSIYQDFKKHQNSMLVSPFFNFVIPKIVKRYSPDYIYFIYRNPIETVSSFYERGYYKEKVFTSDNTLNKATITIADTSEIRSLSNTFSRILPKSKPSFKEWNNLTRIGKCAWFWAIQMKALQEAYFSISGVKKRVYTLDEIDQNYSFYEKLVKEHNLRPKMSRKEFLSLKKITHPEKEKIYRYNDWSDKEKEEFCTIIKKTNLKHPFDKFNLD